MDEKYYEYYYAKKLLTKNIELDFNGEENIKINICAYEVDTTGKSPFLKFILVNEPIYFDYNLLTFPFIKADKKMSFDDITERVCKYTYEFILENNSNKVIKNIHVDGIYKQKNSYYIFLDLTNCKLFINDMNLNNELCLVLIDEIVNTHHVLGTKISPQVSEFFINNKDFLFLVDENRELYEIPTVVYIQENHNRLQFISTFGTSTKDKHAILGPYFYFTDYENALLNNLKNIDEQEVVNGYKPLKTEKTGLNRFALFLGKMKVINNLNNNIDTSEIKTERLSDIKLNKAIEGLTIRISDHDGNWSEEYDSCILGNILLDNGKILKSNPIYVVKEYCQQIPLNYKIF
jgi:hypothetical protein